MARPSPTSEVLPLWYELGRLYAEAGGDVRGAFMRGFAAACAAGALVLLSAPLFGTAWAGPFAAAVPVAAGLLVAVAYFGWRRGGLLKRREAAVSRALAEKGADARRPTAEGLGAYHDVQLVWLRCEYEYLIGRETERARRSAWLFEVVFGFTPEDGFECGPLNVRPRTEGMRSLRERWERRLSARGALGQGPAAMGLGEDLVYGVFPREMTVAAELAARAAYLGISRELMRERYGGGPIPEGLRLRAEEDLREYRGLAGRVGPSRGSSGRRRGS